MLLRILLFITLLGSQLAWGETSPVQPALMDLQQLDEALMDDPKSWIPTVKAQWVLINPDVQPREWLHYAWFLSATDELNLTDLTKAIDLAKKQKEWLLWSQFAFQNAMIDQPDDTYEIVVRRMEDLVKEVRTFNDPLALAYIISCLASYHMGHNALDQGARLIKELNDIRRNSDDSLMYYYRSMESSFALALACQSQYEEAVIVYLKMVETFKQKRLRWILSKIYYDLGLSFIKWSRGSAQLNPKAVEYLQEALHLATEIHDESCIAESKYALSVAYSMLREHDKAISLGKQALTYFESINSKEWIPPGHLRLAKALLAGERFQESLTSIEKAEKSFDKVDNPSLNELVMLRVKAYQGMKQYQQALEQLFTYVTNLTSIFKEQQDKEYARASADLGLQFQKERNSILIAQNDMQAQQIDLLKKFRILSLIIAALLLTLMGVFFRLHRQNREVQASRQRMKVILDTIDEGIMVLDRDLRVSKGYSPHLDTIFESPDQALVGQSIGDLLFGADQHVETRIMIMDSLNTCMGESRLTWDLNTDHLPIEMERAGRILQFHWQPLLQKEAIHGYLLSIRDNTDWKAQEKAMKDDADRAYRLREKLEEILSHDWTAARPFILDVQKNLQALHAMLFVDQNVRDVFRRLHGWKGSARTLSLKQLAAAIHNLENQLDAQKQNFKNREAAEREWELCRTHVEEYANLLVRIPGENSQNQTAQNLYAYVPLYVRSFRQGLNSASLSFQGLAMEDSIEDWIPERLLLVHEILVHALANAMDHGFVLAAKRGKVVRPAHIAVSACPRGELVDIRVLDNGVGIDWQTLRSKTQKDPRSSGIDLFTDGVSTTTATTETSGRGIGMSAIRSICRELGGEVRIEDAEGGGTCLAIQVPLAAISTRRLDRQAI